MAMLFLGVYRHSGELWKGVLAITSKINLLQLWLILDAQTGKKFGIPVLAGIGTNPGIGRYWPVDGMANMYARIMYSMYRSAYSH